MTDRAYTLERIQRDYERHLAEKWTPEGIERAGLRDVYKNAAVYAGPGRIVQVHGLNEQEPISGPALKELLRREPDLRPDPARLMNNFNNKFTQP
jgi:hypothetical protein